MLSVHLPEKLVRCFQEYCVGIDEDGLLGPTGGMGDGTGLAPMDIAASASPLFEQLRIQRHHFYGPPLESLRLIGQHPDHGNSPGLLRAIAVRMLNLASS